MNGGGDPTGNSQTQHDSVLAAVPSLCSLTDCRPTSDRLEALTPPDDTRSMFELLQRRRADGCTVEKATGPTRPTVAVEPVRIPYSGVIGC